MERNLKNIDFDRSQFFDPCQNFMDPRHLCQAPQNLHPHHFLTQAKGTKTHGDPHKDLTHDTHTYVPTQPTLFRRLLLLKVF